MPRVARQSAIQSVSISSITVLRDEEKRRRLTSNKPIKPPYTFRQPRLQRRSTDTTTFSNRPEELRAQAGEASQADHLENETRDHDVDACVLHGCAACGVGDATPDGL